ncbi:WD40 repeat-like protein [Choiromyces venosus 120613-1]|uniref:WD40 repeat-like protein n=1 Tax=Choiromyces venosus 120613-1 TaxID=1336337 RepID=A0A3N4J2H6_9PEZI|nr:WD40 repeat-like protein [Choiromyces venosus 120613-1]
MSSSPFLRHISNLSPVTALAFQTVQDIPDSVPELKLLVGEGPFIKILDIAAPESILLKRRVFSRERIHGITLSSSSRQQNVLFWGGRSVCITRATFLPREECVFEEIRVPDWIFYAMFIPSTSTTPVSDEEVVVITAHNVLLKYDSTSASWYELASGERCMLYSAHLLYLPADTLNSQDRILVAAGTVFGEILLWSVAIISSSSSSSSSIHGLKNPNTHYRLLGHEGSIFDVNISPKYYGDKCYLASCSDDRTIRIWDISQFDSSFPVSSDTEIKKTGFGHELAQGGKCISIGWGHGARIWGVQFLPVIKESLVELLSISEDLTSRFWTFHPGQKNTKNVELKNIATYQLHSGKHIWSYALDFERGLLATGGADGKIGLVHYRDDQESQEEVWGMDSILTQIGVFPDEPAEPNRKDKKTHDTFKEYAALDNDCFAATTTQGRVLTYTLSQKRWDLLGQWTGLKGWSILACWEDSGLIALGDHNGQIGVLDTVSKQAWWWQSMASENGKVAGVFLGRAVTGDEQKYYILTTVLSPTIFSLHSFKMDHSKSPSALIDRETLLLRSPVQAGEAKFLVTSLAINQKTNQLFLGSRAGGLGIYDLSSTIRPLWALSHTLVHPTDAVTAILLLESGILTTSRNGEYSYLSISLSPDICLTKTHASKPSLVIEGARQQDNLTLWGFRGKNFTIINQTSQHEVHSVECGGAHRAWTHRLNRYFVWTKAGKAHLARTYPHRKLLQSGLHGREIKSIASHGDLIATGAEDTLLRLSTLSPSSGQLCPGAVVGTHTTGIHALQFTPNGEYLFSAGGAGELFAWRVRSANEIVLEGTCEGWSDLRIEGFDVLPIEREGADVGSGVLLAIGYSDSTIRLYHFSPSTGTFRLEMKGTYSRIREQKTCCILHVKFLPNNCGILVAGTDGYLSIYPLSKTFSPVSLAHPLPLPPKSVEKRVHQSSIKALTVAACANGVFIYTGGDDCAFGITHIDTKNSVAESWIVPRAHASAVTAVLCVGVRVLTAGVDQKVKLWEVSEGEKGITVEMREQRESAVADISAAEVVGGGKVVIVGVGVDVWEASDGP